MGEPTNKTIAERNTNGVLYESENLEISISFQVWESSISKYVSCDKPPRKKERCQWRNSNSNDELGFSSSGYLSLPPSQPWNL